MVDPWQKVKKNQHTIHFKHDAERFVCEFCSRHFYSKLGYTSHLKQKHYNELDERTEFVETEGEPESVVKEEFLLPKKEEDDVIDDENGFEYTDEEETSVPNVEKGSKSDLGEFVCSCGAKFPQFIDLVRHESNKHTEGFEKMVKGLKDLLLYVINRVDNNLEDCNPKKKGIVVVMKEEEVEVGSYYEDYIEESDSDDNEPVTKVKKKRSPKKDSKQEKFLCQYCDKQLAHRKSLEYHVAKIHHNIPMHRCKLCNRYFTNQEEYEEHAKTHENEPDLCCSFCGFLCKGAAVLRRHYTQKHQSKEMEPRFFCTTCHKGFYYKCKLDEHSIIHKPHTERNAHFSCDICNVSFTRKSALNRHKLCHDEGTKTYACTFCAKTFRRKQHLDAHLAMHTGARAREEVCADCGAIYSERRGLYNHMLRVHGRPLEGYKKQAKIVA